MPSRSLNFEAAERKYNKLCVENKNMQDRLRDRKSTYDRREWEQFAVRQDVYSANARARDVTAGHLPKQRTSTKRLLSAKKGTPTNVNALNRQRSDKPSPKKTHKKKMQTTKSLMIEADSSLDDGSKCFLEISELSTSFHNQYELLTHGSSGLLVTAKVVREDDEGSMASSVNSAYTTGEVIVRLHTLQSLAAKEGLQKKLPIFMTLMPFEERPDLFPTFESALPSDEEGIISQMVLANLFIKNLGGHLRVTVGR